MLETTAPIAVFRTGQGIVPHPKVGRAGVGGGGGGGLGQVGRTAGRDGGYHGGGGDTMGGGGVGARDPRAYNTGFIPKVNLCNSQQYLDLDK